MGVRERWVQLERAFRSFCRLRKILFCGCELPRCEQRRGVGDTRVRRGVQPIGCNSVLKQLERSPHRWLGSLVPVMSSEKIEVVCFKSSRLRDGFRSTQVTELKCL